MFSVRQRRAIRLASRFIAPYRWQALGALLALIVTAGITLSMGQGIRLLVDQGFMTQSPHLLNQSIGLFMVLVLGLAVGTFARFYLVSWIGERVVADIRRQVFNHLIYLHPGFYENNRSSEIQSRLTTDTTLLQSVIGSSLSLFLRNTLMVIGGIVLLFVTNPKLTSIVVVALPLVLAPILIFGRRVRSLSRQSQDRIADVGSYVSETLGQIKTVQAYNHQVQDEQRFAVTVEDAFTTARKRITQRAWLITLVIMLVLGAVGVMLWVGGMDVISGRISGGELAAFVFYSLIVGSAVGTLSEVLGELQRRRCRRAHWRVAAVEQRHPGAGRRHCPVAGAGQRAHGAAGPVLFLSFTAGQLRYRRPEPEHQPWRNPGVGRPFRCGQIDDLRLAAALLRPPARPNPHRRPPADRTRPHGPAPPLRPGVPEPGAVLWQR